LDAVRNPSAISVAIIHAPWSTQRAANVDAIRTAIPHAVVVVDSEREGVDAMTARAWAQAAGKHHLVLQDDVTLCEDFSARLEQAIADAPADALSLYGKAPSRTMVATCMPRGLALAWAEYMRRGLGTDIALTSWLRDRGLVRRFATPSLVAHGSFPSLLRME